MDKKILIVDDASYMRELIKETVKNAGYDVVGEADDGSAAISTFKKLKPDLVTMDIVMNNMTGIDAVKGIMAEDPDAKILIVSAMGHQAMMVEAIQAGASGFIVKPFKAEALVDEMKRILR